MITG
jgi:Mg2+-importing ATPase